MRRFALDQGFPQTIVEMLRDVSVEAELVPLGKIDSRLPDFDDWQILLGLYQDATPWDGLITTDAGMIRLPKELSVLHQTNLTLVVADAAGHDPLKATGLVLAHLPNVCKRTDPKQAQIWVLRATDKNPERAWNYLGKLATRQKTSAAELFASHKLSDEELKRNPR